MDREFYAHSLEGRPPNEWQTLEEHLKNVANMARSFATDFGAGEWGYLAGLWHDIGKYSEKFQKKLDVREGCDAHIETKQGTVDHSTAGAQHAFRTLSDSGKILAYAIAGHHAGLMDGQSNRACLENRLKKIDIPDYSSCPEQILNTGKLSKLPFDLEVSSSKRAGFQISLFIRMIYSCLVDADFLDTEAFMDRERSSWRRGYPSLDVLRDKLDCALNQKVKTAPKTPINRHRAAILKDCLDAAELPQGLFSLTVPTGGGKTLSSLAFAIRHALKHNLKRI
ncbi:MAG: CRISPR-associated endonuclease Cas3'', partial [Deltaproteobacteria bacterium]|nr:CRISPR-associated endonuclease Cas3'' [Deltaproteobacteria bacterium]